MSVDIVAEQVAVIISPTAEINLEGLGLSTTGAVPQSLEVC